MHICKDTVPLRRNISILNIFIEDGVDVKEKDHTNPVRHCNWTKEYKRMTFNLCFWQALIEKKNWPLKRISRYLFRITSSTRFRTWRWLWHGHGFGFWRSYICQLCKSNCCDDKLSSWPFW